MKLDSNIPSGPLAQKWDKHKFDLKLVNPANKRKFDVIVVGTGLAGASAAASMAELGYKVKCFCFQDSPRRALARRAFTRRSFSYSYSHRPRPDRGRRFAGEKLPDAGELQPYLRAANRQPRTPGHRSRPRSRS